MLEGSLEGQAQGITSIGACGLTHQGANEVVGQEVDSQFLVDQVGRFGAEHIHFHGGFEMAQIEFYFPAQTIAP